MTELNSNAQKWVEALRSGKYKQGKGALTEIKDGVEYDCCLGVACKVAVENGVELKSFTAPRTLLSGDRQLVIYKAEGLSPDSFGVLPDKVKEWLGLSESDGQYTKHLTSDNDNGATFEEIAAIVESKPNGLFAEGK